MLRGIGKPVSLFLTVLAALVIVYFLQNKSVLPDKPVSMNATGDGARVLTAMQNDLSVPALVRGPYDITIVVFSDYQCPYCRTLHSALKELIDADPKVRIVYRDWPIFGEASVEAARAAIASNFQGKHAAFDDALMTSPLKLTSEEIRAAADRAGVDWGRLQADLAAHSTEIDVAMEKTDGFARSLRLSGTPALLLNGYLVPGALDSTTLRRAVEQVRHERGRGKTS